MENLAGKSTERWVRVDGVVVVDDSPGEPVDDDERIQEPFSEWKVGDVDSPNLFRMVDFEVSEQIGPDILGMVTLAEVRAREQGDDFHNLQQSAYTFSVDSIAQRMPEIVSQLPTTPRRALQMQLVENPHQVEVFQSLSVAGAI